MGDYVLESNPALEHLIERLHAPAEALPGGAEDRPDWHSDGSTVTSGEVPEVDDDLWVIHEDSQPADDEIVLVDFDEEPEVFDEDLDDYDGDRDVTDETDEVLDLYEDEDWDDDMVLDEDVDVPQEHGRDGENWIFEAFEAWRLEHDAGLVDVSIPGQ